ncbi:MAG: helix-turn-helix transcriptional regulator [Patescibacteria group bacterium]
MGTFYDRLKSLRPDEVDDNDRAYAKWLGIPREQISRWKNGHFSPSVTMVERLAKKLKVSPSWLLFGQSGERKR